MCGGGRGGVGWGVGALWVGGVGGGVGVGGVVVGLWCKTERGLLHLETRWG